MLHSRCILFGFSNPNPIFGCRIHKKGELIRWGRCSDWYDIWNHFTSLIFGHILRFIQVISFETLFISSTFTPYIWPNYLLTCTKVNVPVFLVMIHCFQNSCLTSSFNSFPDIRCGLIVLLARKMCNPITDNLYTVHSTGTSSTFDLYIGSGEPWSSIRPSSIWPNHLIADLP